MLRIKWGIFIALVLQFTEVNAQVIGQIIPIQKTISSPVDKGYVFITPSSLDTLADYPTSLLILDSIGNPVFIKPWTTQSVGPYAPKRFNDFKLQPSGKMSYSALLANGDKGIYILNSDFEIVDSMQTVNGFETDGHDFLHFPDGSYHLVALEERIMDLSSLTTTTGVPGDVNGTILGNVIQTFDAQKNLIFEWKSLDFFALNDVYSHFFTNPSRLDHSHFNSIDKDDDGNYIVSFRHYHEITKVDTSTGQIAWHFGGKNNQFTFIGDTMKFSAQHDARFLDNGNVSLFDNGRYNSTPAARALEYELDEVNMTATKVWEFIEPNNYYSNFTGNNQRLTNGNSLIDWGGAFPLTQTTTATEVDNLGNIALALDFIPDRYYTYRALKYEIPFDLNRPEIICNSQDQTLTVQGIYPFYEWNTGETTQSIVIQDTGTYQVWVNQGIGYMSSEEIYISDLSTMCDFAGVNEIETNLFKIYPNPANAQLYIEYNGPINTKALIFNSLNQSIMQFNVIANENNSLNISTLPAGIYYLKIDNKVERFIKE